MVFQGPTATGHDLTGRRPAAVSSAVTNAVRLPIRLRGSRAAMATAHRLAGYLALRDRELALIMTAVLEHNSAAPGARAPDSFDVAAEGCLSALFLRLVLGSPLVIIMEQATDGPHDLSTPRRPTTVCLELVRAISSAEVEYRLAPVDCLVPRSGKPSGVLGMRKERSTIWVTEIAAVPMTCHCGLRRMGWMIGPGLSSGPIYRGPHATAVGHSEAGGGGLPSIVESLLGGDEARFRAALAAVSPLLTAREASTAEGNSACERLDSDPTGPY